ncbi:MAG TPA: hypothetical protein VN673_18400 [Clostridia bacterium]|nr:hypothetical protein [Clostridia bacterium]
MATKEHKRQAKVVIGNLEVRVHSGPPIAEGEIRAAQDFLRQHNFSPASDYFQRLEGIESRLRGRSTERVDSAANGLSRGGAMVKRNYGGEAGGCRMQVQSVFDHVILSTCYDGEFHTKRGRIKLSHRFNRAGRIEFVELKFLRSLHPLLNGQVRKIVMIQSYQELAARNWHQAEAHALETLPRELVFLFQDAFRCPRSELLAWLINIGHGICQDLMDHLAQPPNPHRGSLGAFDGEPEEFAPAGELRWVSRTTHEPDSSVLTSNAKTPRIQTIEATDGNGTWVKPERQAPEQLPLGALIADEVAMDILAQASTLECSVDVLGPKHVAVRYVTKPV